MEPSTHPLVVVVTENKDKQQQCSIDRGVDDCLLGPRSAAVVGSEHRGDGDNTKVNNEDGFKDVNPTILVHSSQEQGGEENNEAHHCS